MAETNTETPRELTAADVAKQVKRRTVIEDKGATRVVTSAIKADELLAWRDYGTHIVAVTADGHKHSNAVEQ